MAVIELELPHLHKVTAKGKLYYYAWRGGPRIKLDPADGEGFAAEYKALHAARKGGDKAKLSGLIVDWKASDAWTQPHDKGGMADATKANWTRWLDEVHAYFGELSIAQFDRPQIRPIIKKWRSRWKATPRAADMAKQVLSALLSFAVEEGKLAANPCFGIPNLYKNDRSEIIWADDDFARLILSGASREIVYALELAALTGLRQADLLKLTWGHVGELAIEKRTGKSGNKRTALVPLYGELRELLEEIRAYTAERAAGWVRDKRKVAGALHILTNTEGQPWKSGFSSSWNKAMIRMEEDTLHFHDARGTFATKAYLAGFTIREIAELLAWSEDQVERIINRYVRRNALLEDRIRRMDEARKSPGENGSGT
jgi:integrase